MKYTYQIILKILHEKLGFVILDDMHNDFIISDYIPDSLAFINFIISIEEELGKELTDDFLDYDILSSAKGFSEKLDFFIVSLQDDSLQMDNKQ